MQLDAFGNLFAVEFHILFLGNFALAEGGAVRADFSSLREGADRGRGECGQLEFSLLHFAALEAARLALEISGGEGGKFCLHLGVSLYTRSCKQGLILCEGGSVTACEFCKFDELFFGEGEMTERFGRELLFGSNRVRHMQQGAGCSDHHIFSTDSLLDFSEQRILLRVIGTPDVLAVHDTGEQERVLRETGLDQFQRLEAFDKIKTDGIETEGGYILVHVANIAKVSLQGNLEASGTHLLDEFHIDGLEELLFFGGHVEHQSGFGKANPLGAGSGELVGELCISSYCRGGKILRLLLAVVAGQAKERVNANQGRHGLDSGSLRFIEFLHRLGTVHLEFRCVIDFRDNVVVVGVKPLLHREGLHVALFALVTVSGGEILFKRAQVQAPVTFRDNAEQESGIENVIVEREVVRRNEVNASSLLLLPTIQTDFSGDVLEFSFGDFALEELLACKLEFTGPTDTRKTYYRCFFIAHSVLPTFFICFSFTSPNISPFLPSVKYYFLHVHHRFKLWSSHPKADNQL